MDAFENLMKIWTVFSKNTHMNHPQMLSAVLGSLWVLLKDSLPAGTLVWSPSYLVRHRREPWVMGAHVFLLEQEAGGEKILWRNFLAQ